MWMGTIRKINDIYARVHYIYILINSNQIVSWTHDDNGFSNHSISNTITHELTESNVKQWEPQKEKEV